MRQSDKHTNRQLSFSSEMQEFLDSFKRGDMSEFVEATIRRTDRFGEWVREREA
jgi:hypothetical protein